MPIDKRRISALLDEWEAVGDAAIGTRWAVDLSARARCVAWRPTPAEITRAQDLSREAAVLLVALQHRVRCESERVVRI